MSPQTPVAPAVSRRPSDREIDVHGLTHRGSVRASNQDNFLICSLEKRIEVHATSLPPGSSVPGSAGRVAFIAMVADGVGGGQGGEQASRLASEQVARFVGEAASCYYRTDSSEQDRFGPALREAALRAHAAVLEAADSDAKLQGMATTLTLWLGVWPAAYLVQVGDSRCYLFRDGMLRQMSTDQTMATELVKQGVLTEAQAPSTRWSHVLSSALGGHSAEPVVTYFEQQWGDVGLLCSDGLTRHVSDARIAERLGSMTSSRQAAEALLQDALEGGGSDNITIVIGRTLPPADGGTDA